jgi:hypothetical protein
MNNTAEGRNWGAEDWRAPKLEDDDTLLYSECGRVVKAHTYGHDNNGIDYRSHYFSIVKKRFGGCWLLVHHGGGQEQFQLDHSVGRVRLFFESLDSTQRYLLMHAFYNVHSCAREVAASETAATYRKAFVDGRLKKRKNRGRDTVKVWIEPKR